MKGNSGNKTQFFTPDSPVNFFFFIETKFAAVLLFLAGVVCFHNALCKRNLSSPHQEALTQGRFLYHEIKNKKT